MAELDPENARILSYLQAQAAKLTISEIQEKVTEGATALRASAVAIDESQYDTVPPGEEWTPRQLLEHVAEWHLRNAREVFFVALTGELPFDEERNIPASRDEMLAAMDAAFESLFIHLADATPDYFLETKWEHPMFGPLNWREWFLFLRLHCYDHSRQLDAMRASFA